MKVCVYAICKNERRFVERWIDSMSEADYVVVLDTGSTDGTFEYLENDKRVCRVQQKIFNQWRFDDARNESMRLIPEDTDICVCTDLDETFEPGWCVALKNEWIAGSNRGCYLYTWSHHADGTPDSEFLYDKIHTRNYKWNSPVHEYLTPIDDTVKPCRLSSKVHLHHYPDMGKSRGYYLDLMELRASENQSQFTLFYLAREYGFNNRWNDALDTYRKSLINASDKFMSAATWCRIGDIYCANNKWGDALISYSAAIDTDETFMDSYLSMAAVYIELTMYNMAVSYVEMGLAKARQRNSWLENPTSFKGCAEDILSVAHYHLGNVELARMYYKKAIELNPNDARIRNNGKYFE